MPTSTQCLTKPPCTHREELPVRECMSCGAYLRTGNVSTTCDPCGVPPWEQVEDEVFGRIAEMQDVRDRRRAFEAYAEIVGRA
jgi:hypothetical protein